MEVLAGQLPEHETRVNGVLETFDQRLRGLADELTGRMGGLESTFLNHRHDPPPEAAVPAELPEVLDNPVQEIDQALGDALPTPEAPQGPAVEAPRAFKKIRPGGSEYHSRLHRGR